MIINFFQVFIAGRLVLLRELRRVRQRDDADIRRRDGRLSLPTPPLSDRLVGGHLGSARNKIK